MNIEIHQPELEALIQQRMASGHFQSIEEVLMHALKFSPETAQESTQEETFRSKQSLAELFQPIRGLLTDEEVDTVFRRDPSPGRSVDLS